MNIYLKLFFSHSIGQSMEELKDEIEIIDRTNTKSNIASNVKEDVKSLDENRHIPHNIRDNKIDEEFKDEVLRTYIGSADPVGAEKPITRKEKDSTAGIKVYTQQFVYI